MLGEKRRCGDRLVLEVRDCLEATKTKRAECLGCCTGRASCSKTVV